MLDLDLINTGGGTQSRLALNDDVVADYAEAYANGATFPPVVVFFDGKTRWLADGFHRYFGAKKASKTAILEDIRVGTKQDAFVFSLGANNQHGLKRTNADKRHAVELAFKNDELSKHSDNSIAKICAVSQPFVSEIRKTSLITVISGKPAERTFTSKHGTESTMQTANIGKAAKPVKQTEPVAPVILAIDDEGAPDDAEMESVRIQEEAEAKTMQFMLASDEPLADLAAKNTELEAQIKQLNLRIAGLQNSNNEYIKTIKRLQNQLKKVQV